MKILVCFKALPDPDKIIAKDWENFSLETDILYAGSDLNCFDQSALEIGLKIKEQEAVRGVEATCTALTVSDKVSSLISCNLYSVGYDEVLYLPLKQSEFQPEKISEILYSYAKDKGFDVVITGSEAGMAETGMVPYLLAEKLKYPIVTGVEETKVSDELIVASCRNDEGLIEKTLSTPIVLNIGNSPEILRMPTLKKRMAFMGKKATEIENAFEDESINPNLKRPQTGRTCSMLEVDEEYLDVSKTVLQNIKNALSEAGNKEENNLGPSNEISKALVESALFVDPRIKYIGGYEIIADEYKKISPKITVFPDTEIGRGLAIQLAERQGMKCLFDVEFEKVDKTFVSVKRRVYSANLEWRQDIEFPAVFTVAAEEAKKLSAAKRFVLEEPNVVPDYIKNEKLLEKNEENALSSSNVVFVCGAGLKSKDACEKVRKLADSLGAAVGFTRVAALNAWGNATEIIGQSGTIIAPKCVIALGTAGAGAFLVGIEKADKIIAINTDKSAIIFKNADIGINMDAETLVDKLLELR